MARRLSLGDSPEQQVIPGFTAEESPSGPYGLARRSRAASLRRLLSGRSKSVGNSGEVGGRQVRHDPEEGVQVHGLFEVVLEARSARARPVVRPSELREGGGGCGATRVPPFRTLWSPHVPLASCGSAGSRLGIPRRTRASPYIPRGDPPEFVPGKPEQ